MKITNLKLKNFRRFKDLELKFNKNWTILVAPNAHGKSTIIEAIHLLATGESPWTSDNSTMFPKASRNTESKESTAGNNSPNAYQDLLDKTLRLEGEVENVEEFKKISISIQKNNDSLTKTYEIEGSNTTKNKFAENLHTILFSPQMIDLLMYEPRQRRKFLDNQISRTDYFYYDLTVKYTKVRRQRNSLLKAIKKDYFKNGGSSNGPHKLSSSQQQNLKFWTEQLIDLGSQIIKKRINFIETINSSLENKYTAKLKYTPKVNLSQLEELASEDYIKDIFQSQLRNSYKKERSRGTTIVGPHRDDWNLQAKNTNLNVYGSRGEKRMAIADIMFKINEFLAEEIGEPPIVLLDDISSELDKDNISLLFQGKINPNQQAIITTTHLEQIPEESADKSQIILLDDISE